MRGDNFSSITNVHCTEVVHSREVLLIEIDIFCDSRTIIRNPHTLIRSVKTPMNCFNCCFWSIFPKDIFSIRSVRVPYPHSNVHWTRKMLKFLRIYRISFTVYQKRKPWHSIFSELKSRNLNHFNDLESNEEINVGNIFLDHQKALNSDHWTVLHLKKHFPLGLFVIIVRCDCLNVLQKFIWALEHLKWTEL